MLKEEFERHTFEKDEEVIVGGKPVRVISASRHSLTVQIRPNHYKTVLPVEVELIDGGGCEFR